MLCGDRKSALPNLATLAGNLAGPYLKAFAVLRDLPWQAVGIRVVATMLIKHFAPVKICTGLVTAGQVLIKSLHED